MVDWSRELKFPFLAGSSLPVTWRMPSIDMPYGAEVEELMCVAMGGLDSYDFHALEVIQCMAERRRGGETGVACGARPARTTPFGKRWKPAVGRPAAGIRNCSKPASAAARRSGRTETRVAGRNAQPSPSHARADPQMGRQAGAVSLSIQGSRTGRTMLLMNGLVEDFTFAAHLKGQPKPLSTLFYLPPNPNVTYSAALMSKAEEMFTTGHAPYPIERTLLTTGLVAAGMESLGKDQARLETPHLAIRYQAPKESLFWRT